MLSLEDIQESWMQRWKDKPIERPTCYNRPNFDWIGNDGCSAWFEGGNASSQKKLIIDGGKTYPWSVCNGCKQKLIKGI